MVNTQLYGDRGPWASKKGYGPSARAIGGLTWLWAHGPDAPRGVMTIHPDHVAGRLVALAALAGLHARERTGRGCARRPRPVREVFALLGDLLARREPRARRRPAAGQPLDRAAPWNLFRCADETAGAERWLAVCVPDDAAWQPCSQSAPANSTGPNGGRTRGSARRRRSVRRAWPRGYATPTPPRWKPPPEGGGARRPALFPRVHVGASALCGPGLSGAGRPAGFGSAAARRPGLHRLVEWVRRGANRRPCWASTPPRSYVTSWVWMMLLLLNLWLAVPSTRCRRAADEVSSAVST